MILLRYFVADLRHHLRECRGACELPAAKNDQPALLGADLRTRIKRYYHENQLFYDLFWTDSQNFSMNYGFWYSGTRTLAEALLNQNRAIAEALDIGPADLVLEAGCGTGGTSIWLARHYGAHIIGITLSDNQARRASKIAASKGVGN